MKSREPVLVRGRDYWDEISMPAETFEERIDQIRELMSREDLDAVLVYGRGDHDGHLCYVSNLVNKVPIWGLLVVITPETVVVRNERSSRTRPVIERGTWIENIEFVDDVLEEIDERLDGVGPEATVGTVGFETLPYRQRAAFRRQLEDCEIVSVDDALWELRRVKSDEERDQIARAGRILEELQTSLSDGSVRPSDESALAARIDRLARLRGFQDVRVLVGNPAKTERHLRPAEDVSIGDADPITVYVAGRYEGYWAECARPLRLDGRTPHESVYDDAVDLYTGFLGALRSGRDVNVVADRLESRIDATDLELADDYSLGHGIGLDVEEPPFLGADCDRELAAGMTLSARLAVEPDPDSLLVFTDTVVVRDGEPAVLTGDWW